MQNVAPINSSVASSIQLEGLDVGNDGKLKVCFTQGIEFVIDPNNKVFSGRGVTLRVGGIQTSIVRDNEGLQISVDGFVINVKR